MKSILIAALLLSASTLSAQIPASSPALDPDFVILQPKEEYTGRYANQMVGSVIKTVAPLNWKVPEGVVFLRNVDTIGYSELQISDNQPGGPFLQDAQFSLFNHALFRKFGLRDPVMVFNRGMDQYPVMVAKSFDHIRTPFLFFYFPDDSGSYEDTIFSYTPKAYLLGTAAGWAVSDVDNDGFDDLFCAEEADKDEDDSTSIGLWYSQDIKYKGDTLKDHSPILPPSQEWVLPNRLRGAKLVARDFDRDGAIDLCYNTEHKSFTIVFGKVVDQKWNIDTVVSVQDSAIKSFLFMDFLHEDGIADLILGTDDTIYCFSGAEPNFLRHGFQLADADFKIPAPGSIDPGHFGGSFGFWFGDYIFNAGNLNGSGVHSFAVMGGRNLDDFILGAPYVFIYSGGRAADEKVDAIFADTPGNYNGFANLDTVNIGSSPTGIIVGDPGHSAGTNGKIWYILGDKTIPHRPNPKWSVISRTAQISALRIECSGMAADGMLKVSIYGAGTNGGTLILLDMLGREVASMEVAYLGPGDREASLAVRLVPPGCYMLEYIEGRNAVAQKILLTKFSYGEEEKHFLPERYVLPPYVPPVSEWVENRYTSGVWEALILTAAQRQELRKLKLSQEGMDPEEYAWRLHDILHREGDLTTK